jgi:hypothetical protein
VAPLFHYVEKGDKNDGDVSCSITATLFFLPCQAGNEISWQKFHEILRKERDIIARPTRMLQFWSEMQQT